MKKLILVIAAIFVAGCASNTKRAPTTNSTGPMWEWLFTSTCPGTRPEDPQFCRGESWVQIPNQEFEAQIRRARGEQW